MDLVLGRNMMNKVHAGPDTIAAAEFLAGITEARLLAIIRGADPEAAIRVGLELVQAGFRYLEVSLNTADALRVIAAVAREAAGTAFVGAGTVLSVSDVTRATEAGSSFLVTPAVAPSVLESVRLGVPVIAGAETATEVYTAMELGATAIKLFPASAHGPRYLSALRDPLPDTPFIPVGGVDLPAAEEYWARGAVAVGVGGPLVQDAVAGGDLAALRARAKAFLDAAAAAR